MVNIENCHTYLLQFLRYAWNFLGQTYDFSLYTGGDKMHEQQIVLWYVSKNWVPDRVITHVMMLDFRF